jgi:hypothetical protein
MTSNKRRISVALIRIPFAALILSSMWMVTYVQETERLVASQKLTPLPIICESSVREAGIARICIAVVGLLRLLIPFRQRRRWSWLTFLFLFLTYFVPVFVFPHLHPFPGWDVIPKGFVQPGAPRVVMLDLLLPLLILVGLVLSFLLFFPRRPAPA